MPGLIDRPDDDSSVDTDSSWGSMPGLTSRPDSDDESWSDCSWDIDSQAESWDTTSGTESEDKVNMKTVVELSNIDKVKQVDVSNAYINVPIGTIPVFEDGDGTHVGSLPDLAPDSNDLEEVGDAIEGIAGHKLVRQKKQRIPLLQVIWDNGKTSWEPLKHLKKDVPCMVATYVNVNKLGKPYHRSWAAKVIRKKFQVIEKMRRAAGCSDNVMYGIKVPKNVKQALEFDKENGNTFWEDSIKK